MQQCLHQRAAHRIAGVAAQAFGAQQTFDTQADGTNSLAVDTGGFAIRNENNFGRALDEIQHDAGTYYVLSYRAENEVFDGKYRTISVKVRLHDFTTLSRSALRSR